MKKVLSVQWAANERSIGRDARTLDCLTPLHDLCANEITKLFRRAAHRLGARSDSYVEVMEGVKDGEPVVVAANFLIDAESNLKAALGGLAAAPGSAPATTSKAVSHQATGTLDGIDAKTGSVTVTHGPVASLKWPGMTMDFVLANPALTEKFKPGSAVSIEFVERKPGEWVITRMDAQAQTKPIAPAAAATTPAHKGH